MFAIRNAVRRVPKMSSLTGAQRRTVVSTPPTEKVSMAEKITVGAVFYLSIISIPFFIATRVKTYVN